MRMIFAGALGLALTGCGPSFEDKIVGTWECIPADQPEKVSVVLTMIYGKDGSVKGGMAVNDTSGPQALELRGKLDGTWTYDGTTLGHTMTESFESLAVDGKTLPDAEVPPEVKANFRSQDSYDDPVDLVEDQLVWYEGEERKTVAARCSKKV
ncbi:hypothetical protein [Erythrobacter donghaensis]|uniref:hypothetical protein n=1 Tax=Erythrobacter donghaensis TaxID=267135 RepID=UPI00117C140A|nr:hypothetical protein [Erythrobacter donghaensis]